MEWCEYKKRFGGEKLTDSDEELTEHVEDYLQNGPPPKSVTLEGCTVAEVPFTIEPPLPPPRQRTPSGKFRPYVKP